MCLCRAHSKNRTGRCESREKDFLVVWAELSSDAVPTSLAVLSSQDKKKNKYRLTGSLRSLFIAFIQQSESTGSNKHRLLPTLILQQPLSSAVTSLFHTSTPDAGGISARKRSWSSLNAKQNFITLKTKKKKKMAPQIVFGIITASEITVEP